MLRKNKVKYCKQYGLQWNGFKIPKGAIYGRIDDTLFVCTKFPVEREHAQRIFIWERSSVTGNWHEFTMTPYFDDMINTTNGNYNKAVVYTHIAGVVLAYLRKYPLLKIEGYRHPLCDLYTRQVTPKRRQVGKYIPMPSLFSQDGVDGRGFAPSKCKDGMDGTPEDYSGAMAEFFPTGGGCMESAYWDGLKAY